MSDPLLSSTGSFGTGTANYTAPVGTSVGDVIILDLLMFKAASFTPGTDTVTVPSGWTSLGGIPEPGYARSVRRQWWKFASSGDLSGTITISYGAAFSAFLSDRRANILTVVGGTGISGGPHSTGRLSGDPTPFSVTVPDPTQVSVGLVFSYVGHSGGSGFSQIGPSWEAGYSSASDTQRAFGPPPYGVLVYASSDEAGFNAFAVTLPKVTCQVFKGKLVATTTVANVVLSALSGFAIPADYRVKFVANTTGHSIPSGGSLASSYTIGTMRAGDVVEYEVYRTDGAHIDGPAVMRATDTVSGLQWDVAVSCLLPTRFQYNSIGLPAEYSTRQFAVGSNSQG